ncbi:MAG: hypothetical protein SGI87_05350, partial [Flavobacteriales bacterium]|nr:hypothetical protein [Flavobacteriales bacterium]
TQKRKFIVIILKARTYSKKDTLRRHGADFQIRQAFVNNTIITGCYNIYNTSLSTIVDKYRRIYHNGTS